MSEVAFTRAGLRAEGPRRDGHINTEHKNMPLRKGESQSFSGRALLVMALSLPLLALLASIPLVVLAGPLLGAATVALAILGIVALQLPGFYILKRFLPRVSLGLPKTDAAEDHELPDYATPDETAGDEAKGAS